MSCEVCYNTCYGYVACTCDMTCYGQPGQTQYKVQIDGTGSPNTFKWSDDGGSSWDATGVSITGLDQTLNNGVTIRFDSTIGHTLNDYWVFWMGDGVWIGERLMPYFENFGGSNLVRHQFWQGSTIQIPSSAIQTELPQWKEAMRRTSYSWFRLTYDTGAFKSVPDFTILLMGKKIFDPRNGQTDWSDNPALVVLDWLIIHRYGLGVGDEYIDMDSFKEAANWCDANDYKFNGIINDRQAFSDNMEDILNNFRGFILWSGNKFKLKIFSDDAAVMALTEDDIEIEPSSFSFNIPGIPEAINKVKCIFPDKKLNYIANFATFDEPEIISYEGISQFELPLIGTTDFEQAYKLAKFILKRKKYGTTFQPLAHPRTFILEPGDMITVTHEFMGWSSKKLRVSAIALAEGGLVSLTLVDENAEIYT